MGFFYNGTPNPWYDYGGGKFKELSWEEVEGLPGVRVIENFDIDYRPDLKDIGSEGAYQLKHYKLIVDSNREETKIWTKDSEWLPKGSKCVSVKRDKEILSEKETKWRPSSAWGMGKEYSGIIRTYRIHQVLTYEDGTKIEDAWDYTEGPGD